MKKKLIIVITVLLVVGLILAGGVGYKVYQDNIKEQQELEKQRKKEQEEKELLDAILASYTEKVITINDAKLYKLDEDNFVEVGNISKDVNVLLEVIEKLSLENEYFKLKDSNYYVYHADVRPNEVINLNTDYKNYVPFDSNIVTKSSVRLYLDGEEIYTINDELQLAIIINDTNSYHVEFNGQLVEIKKEDVKETVASGRSQAGASQIGVLNYHFFYDPNKGERCDENICLTTQKFEEQLKYLKDNGFYTATMSDMALWMEKKIKLPVKTAVITVDDGAMGTGTHNGHKLIPLLEKYDLHGTLFLITAWWPKENYISNNLEIQSHGDNIHNYIAEALYKSKQQLLTDFKLSIDKLDGENTAFCYPFYAQNQTVRSAVSELGFKIAFVGGNVKATQNNNRYQINRYVVLDTITMNQFINMVN